jgi:hypothetical protein
VSEEKPLTPLQQRVAALPGQMRALVEGMDPVHYGPFKIVNAAADEIQHGPASYCRVCSRSWRELNGETEMCGVCAATIARLLEQVRAAVRRGAAFDAAVSGVITAVVEAAEPSPPHALYGGSGFRCPLCDDVTQSGQLFTVYGLRRHVFGWSGSSCRIAEVLRGNARDWRDEQEQQRERRRARQVEPLPEYCYLIRCETSGNLKIGKAIDAQRRLADLQRGSGTRLTLLAALKTASGYTLEAEMHERFAAHRLHGEWFAADPAIYAAFGVTG